MTTSKKKKQARKLEELVGTEGIKADYPLMKVLNKKNIDSCGYLRSSTYANELFFGNCALLNFERCYYPCHLPILAFGKYESFDCPVYRGFMKKQSTSK